MADTHQRWTDVQIPEHHRNFAVRVLIAAGLLADEYRFRARRYHPDFGAHPAIVAVEGPVSGEYSFDPDGRWLAEFQAHVAQGLYRPGV
jgi:hypothetical protein